MGAYDVQRIKPPKILVVHHSISPEGDSIRRWTDQQVADWFNTIGRSRTYAGYAHSYHYDPRTGRETFAAVQIALWPNGDGKDIYSDSWRVIQLTQSWFDDLCWHAGNWQINRQSVGCETYGRYDNKPLPETAVWALAKWAKNNIDARNNGATVVAPHKQFFATACPGDWANKLGLLVDMINNPQKYGNKYEQLSMEERQQLQAQINLFQEYINARDARIRGLEAQIASQNYTLSMYETDKQNWIRDREALNSQINGLNSQIVALNNLVAQKQAEINELNNRYANFASVLAQKESQIANLNGQVSGLRAELGNRDSIINDLNKKIADLYAQIAALQNTGIPSEEIKSLQERLAYSESQREYVITKLDEALKKTYDLQRKLDECMKK